MMCEYFLLCTNEAAGTVAHPILIAVPTCERCAAKFELTITPFDEDIFNHTHASDCDCFACLDSKES